MKSLFPILCCLILSITLSAREPEIALHLEISDDAGGYQLLTFGVDSMATDTIDTFLGEKELPPFPPSGAFEARFIGDDIGLELGQGTHKDFRKNQLGLDSTLVFEMRYQVGSGSTIKIKWHWPAGALGNLQDLFGGVIIDKKMAGKDSIIIDNPGALDKLRMTATLSETVPVELTDFQAKVVRDHVDLAWRTESESNNLGFEIQKSSDGVTFSRIGFVPGAGTSTLPHDYTFQDTELSRGTLYYRLKQMDTDGAFMLSDPVSVAIVPPSDFVLEQNYPNPFNPATTIRYSLSTTAQVHISVVALNGSVIATLVEEYQNAGTYELLWDADHLPTGIFMCRMQAGDYIDVKKMVLIK